MKKIIVMSLALVLVFGLAACGESPASSDAEDRLTAYKPSFEEITAEYGEDIKDLSYFLFDLNGDGVTEILIKGTLPYDEYKWLYALDSGKPVKIGEYWSRSDYTGIYSGGYIYGFGSNGASEDVQFIEQMKPGSVALTTVVSVENHQDENGNVESMLNGEKVTGAEAETAMKAYDDTRGEEIVPKWIPYADSSVKQAPGINTPEKGDEDLAYWNGFDFGENLTYNEEYKMQADPGDYMNCAEAAKLVFDEVKANGNIPGYSDNTEYKMTLIDLMNISGEQCHVYRCDGGDFSAAFAYAYQSGSIYMQGHGGEWVKILDYKGSLFTKGMAAYYLSSLNAEGKSWGDNYNSVNYVLDITTEGHYDDTFAFNIDDEISGVAVVDPKNPYRASYKDMIFAFDGEDTIQITGGGYYSETYFRSQARN